MAVWFAVMLAHETVNEPEDVAAGIGTEAGTARADELLANATAAPAETGALKAMVHVVVDPEVSDVLPQVSPVTVTGGVTAMLVVTVCVPSDAVSETVAAWDNVVATVAVKVAERAPAATVIEAGTETAALLEARETEVPAAGAALERVMVQVVLVFAGSDVAAHWRAEMTGNADRERAVVCDVPLREAVTVAVWSAVNEPAVTEKEAEVAAGDTATEEGMVNSVELVVTLMAVLNETGALRVTEQFVVIPGISTLPAHASPVNAGGGVGAGPAATETASASPEAEAATAEPMVTDVFVTPATRFMDTFARTPSEITFEFGPEAMQVYVPSGPLQLIVLPAAVSAGPAATCRLAIVPVGKEKVH